MELNDLGASWCSVIMVKSRDLLLHICVDVSSYPITADLLLCLGYPTIVRKDGTPEIGPQRSFKNIDPLSQLVQQCLRLLQIFGLKAFRKPVDYLEE